MIYDTYFNITRIIFYILNKCMILKIFKDLPAALNRVVKHFLNPANVDSN